MSAQFPQLPPVNDPLDRPKIDLPPNNPKVSEVAAKKLSSPVPLQKRPRSLSENNQYTFHRRDNHSALPSNGQNRSQDLTHRLPQEKLDILDVLDGILEYINDDNDSSSDDSYIP